MVKSGWGDQETQFFFELVPEKVLEAVDEMRVFAQSVGIGVIHMEDRVVMAVPAGVAREVRGRIARVIISGSQWSPVTCILPLDHVNPRLRTVKRGEIINICLCRAVTAKT